MCDLAATAAADTICADSNRVLVLLHARHTDQSSMHMFDNGLLRSISVEHRDCIYMQQGVLWVDAVLLPQQPRKRERETMLQRVETHANARNGRLTSLAQLPSPGIWRRQRHVLTGSPRQDMRVELLLQRDAVPPTVEVAVGIVCKNKKRHHHYDVQLTAVCLTSLLPGRLMPCAQLCMCPRRKSWRRLACSTCCWETRRSTTGSVCTSQWL